MADELDTTSASSNDLPMKELGDMTPREFLDWAKQQVSRAKNDRIPFEKQWYLNLAFYAGRQWVQWFGESAGFDFARMFEPKKKAWQVRLTDNLIRPRVLRQVAKLSQERPRGYVVPATTDGEDMMAADAAEKIYTYLSTEEMELDSIMMEGDWWTTICGTGFIKTYYDEYRQAKSGPPGTIVADALSPFHVFVPDLACQDIQRQPWIAHVCTKSLEEMNRLWPGRNFTANARSGSGSVLNDKFMSAIGIGDNDANDAVLYYEMFIKNHPSFPGGVKIGWCQDHILYVSPAQGEARVNEETGEEEEYASPFVNGIDYPIVRLISRPSGKFYGDSAVTDMIPLQMEWNRGISQVVENRNRMGRPSLLAQEGTMDTRTLTAEPGAVHFFRGMGTPPTPLPAQETPSSTFNLLQLTKASIDEQISQSDMAHGDAPGRVEAATALAILQDEANMVISLQVRNKEIAIEAIGQHFLFYVHTYWKAPRTLSITGRNKVAETLEFDASSTKGNTNFRIEPGSAQPVSRAGKQALILELMDKGAIPVGKAMQFLTYGDVTKLYEELQPDSRRAERENVKMSKPGPDGQPFLSPVELYDDDIVHIQVHDDDMKRQELETLDPMIVKVRKYHTFLHLKNLAAKNQVMPMIPPEILQASDMMTQPMQDPSTGQQLPPRDPFFVHPLYEMELRRIFDLIVANGGMAPPQPVMPSPGGGAVAPQTNGQSSPVPA